MSIADPESTTAFHFGAGIAVCASGLLVAQHRGSFRSGEPKIVLEMAHSHFMLIFNVKSMARSSQAKVASKDTIRGHNCNCMMRGDSAKSPSLLSWRRPKLLRPLSFASAQ